MTQRVPIEVGGKVIDIAEIMPDIVANARTLAEAHYNGDGQEKVVQRWGRFRWGNIGPTLRGMWIDAVIEKVKSGAELQLWKERKNGAVQRPVTLFGGAA